MAYIRLNDDAIWVTRIEGDVDLRNRLAKLAPGKFVELEVAGVVGRWEKMRTGKDGRPTLGIKPVGPMRDKWKAMQNRRGETVEIREVAQTDSYLAALLPLLSEWDSTEDDEAYRDL